MHVAVLAHSRHPIATPFAGGLESLTWYLVKGLVQRGVLVSLFASPGSDPGLGVEELAIDDWPLSSAARDDAAMFVATDGQVEGVRLHAALDHLHRVLPAQVHDDLELARAILVQ